MCSGCEKFIWHVNVIGLFSFFSFCSVFLSCVSSFFFFFIQVWWLFCFVVVLLGGGGGPRATFANWFELDECICALALFFSDL